uniref:Riboflavin biosynthesis protein n=1 Tax=Candidatus Kentrum sp. FM TaxID=2126340 RepID=A0A450W556_9GAMM|nr:MAG: riboflavin kinase / FMN adenylyltransferase [Candidatus Kentron sp. FM]VFJ74238.1 MAG: riboflavin kinase / FMN adenylyltransferase [Candidatus Kentron sp. FM]VFK12187.1 MAG: riboflavin kinase / FMN adenylyltransferase [Candidatus Kentron sp. FM]
MEIIRGLHNLHPGHRGCVLTIGNFDGIHLGHRAVLTQLARVGGQMRLPAVLITFEPQAREFFVPDSAPIRLTRLREKLVALRELPLERVCCLRFDHRLAGLEAPAFVDRLLHRGLGARYVLVGDDFRFGRRREGDVGMLRAEGARRGFEVGQLPTCFVAGERVSSTRIRNALGNGDLATAQELLGRQYSLCGRIIHGDRRGTALGFPTANIDLHRRELPVTGVFAVEVDGLAERSIPGVANIGTRPTVDGVHGLMEVHLLDFNRDVYSRLVRVRLLHKFRDERRFDSIDALKHRIREDTALCRAYFGRC